MRGRSSKRQPSNAPQRQPAAERVSLQLIADKLARLTWRRRLWGVDERQVWHVVQRLDEMYRQLYREQEVRYQALLEQARLQGQPQPTQGRLASGSIPAQQAAQAGTAGSTVQLSAAQQAQARVRREQSLRPQQPQQPQAPQPLQRLQQPSVPSQHCFRTS